MKIECILQRQGGTYVELPGCLYHFAPQDDGKHVSEVSIEAHIERFLAIPEAYRMLRAPGDESKAIFEQKSDAPNIPVDPETVALLGSSVHPQFIEVGGDTYKLDDIVARAHKDSGLSVEIWNELPDETRSLKIDMVLDALEDGEIHIHPEQAEPAQEAPKSEAAPEPTRKELIALYEAKFGKKPSNATSVEAIKAKLAEA